MLHWANEGISDIYTLDPARGPDYNGIVAGQLVFGGLVRFGPGFRILPDAAAHWTVGDGGRTYTFFLRPGVRFGDGTPLTAADVAFSLNRVLSPAHGGTSNADLLADIQGVPAALAGTASQVPGIQVIDDRTIRLRLSRPSGSFLARLATQAGWIVPPLRVRADPSGWDQHAIGTGPFMVTRWVHGQSIQFSSNPFYYGGRIQIAGIDMPLIPEPLTAYKLYRAGALDIMGTIHFPTEALYAVKEIPDFHPSPWLETIYLSLNTRAAPFGDPLVRQAFAAAIDKTALVRAVYTDFAHPAAGMLPPGMVGFGAGMLGIAYDPARARALLARAGFPGGHGMPAVTYLVDQDAQSLVLASYLAAQWQRTLGVRVHLVQLDHSSYNVQLTNRAYQLAVIDWIRDYPDPQNFLSQLLHSGSPNNNGDWHDPTFDHLVDEADHMPADSPRRLALYRAAESIAVDQAATIPLVNPTSGILLRPTVQGLEVDGGQILAVDWTKVRIQARSGT